MSHCTTPSSKDAPTYLIEAFRTVADHRCDRGKRFELAFLLSIVFLGFLKGKTSIEACVSFATHRYTWLSKRFDLSHGIPDATTITRALAVTLPQDVIRAVNQFIHIVNGITIEVGVSLDGKTIRAISELQDGCKHFLSLFSHTTCRILDQEGVVSKENEITATPRLLARHCLLGSVITGDALLTQTKITQAIREVGADYLLIVKGNHPDLLSILKPTFTDPLTHKAVDIFTQTRKTRSIQTVITLTQSLDLIDLHSLGWQDIAVVGKLERSGTRTTKGRTIPLKETIYFISSKSALTPQQAYQFIRNHWHIENKLHWQKDVTWKEDRQRTRAGNAPSILSYLRSLSLQFIRENYHSVTKAIEDFTEKPQTYFNLLTRLQIA